jgi:hypothetical protein
LSPFCRNGTRTVTKSIGLRKFREQMVERSQSRRGEQDSFICQSLWLGLVARSRYSIASVLGTKSTRVRTDWWNPMRDRMAWRGGRRECVAHISHSLREDGMCRMCNSSRVRTLAFSLRFHPESRDCPAVYRQPVCKSLLKFILESRRPHIVAWTAQEESGFRSSIARKAALLSSTLFYNSREGLRAQEALWRGIKFHSRSRKRRTGQLRSDESVMRVI